MNNLPYLLAGPIIRRVDKKSVCIWLATSEKPELNLELLLDDQKIEARVIKTPSFQLGRGAALWVTLLRIKPPHGKEHQFPVDQIIHYKIFNRATNDYLDLSAACYSGEKTPSFIIPSSLNTMAFGSCRKPHGFSQNDKDEFQKADSLALLGQELQAHFDDTTKRPSLLCLSGDQIYADDVLEPVMELLQKQVKRLFPELIPLPDDNLSNSDVGLSLECRQDIKCKSGLSSSAPNAHLLSFAEYAAMYLFVFGNSCGLQLNIDLHPEGDDPQFLTLLNKLSPKIATSAANVSGVIHESEKDYQKAEQSLRGFADSLSDVRKLLANVSTYMIFDDHDVTDDWNISRLWYDNVRKTKNGTRIVANALAAYWAFQGWGNDPDKFSKHFMKTITQHLNHPDDPQKAENYDFHLWKWHHWSFVIETTPPIMALDTRTQRDFGGYNAPPKLLNRYGTDQLRADWLNLKQNVPEGISPIIISATPVFGYAPIEYLQKLAYKIGLFFGNQTGKFTSDNLDLESWVANKQGLSHFLNTLTTSMKLTDVVFLSGDVHYSFAHQGCYKSDKTRLDYLQLTSSALRNTPKKPRFFARFLHHKTFAYVKGIINPEILPWWARVFWKLFKPPCWQASVQRVLGEETNKKQTGRTSRPNIGLLYFEAGKLQTYTLLSGDYMQDKLVYRFDTLTSDSHKKYTM